ncbi:MAG: GNAT family N-acetyltransferase [bacterium]|nr:GNAT family N-acetyltransferase [bacterium]
MPVLLPNKLSLDKILQVVDVQARAFQDDPLWVYLIPNPEKRAKMLKRFFVPVFDVAIRSGQAYSFGDPIAGVCVWSMPSDNPSFSVVLPAIPRFFGLLVSPFILQFGKALPIFSKFGAMKKQYATKPYYYLNTISVAPEAQGRGVASKLIKPFLTKADEEGANVYTETITPENVSLYVHYGFEVMEEYPVPNTDLRLWSFYRRAKTG